MAMTFSQRKGLKPVNQILQANGMNVTKVMFAAFHKSLFHFWAALDLAESGLFGSARPLLRLIYEGLLIAKYCSSRHDTALFDRWIQGDPYVSLGRDVLKKVIKPDMRETKILWADLCSYTHFSVYSGQISANTSLSQKESVGDIFVFFMLLHMNSHLLRQHLLDKTMTYSLDRHADKSWRAIDPP